MSSASTSKNAAFQSKFPSSHNKPKTLSRLQCYTCKRRFVNNVALSHHVRSHGLVLPTTSKPNRGPAHGKSSTEVKTDVAVYSCKVCTRKFTSSAGLTNHAKVHKSRPNDEEREFGSSNFNCKLCGIEFETKGGWIMHCLSHERKKCKNLTTTTTTTTPTTTTSLPGVVTFKCVECLKLFGSQPSLFKHRPTHSGTDVKECKECGIRFLQSGTLYRHAMAHKKRLAHGCHQCTASYDTAEELETHTFMHENENANYVTCDRCKFVFASQAILEDHFDARHKVKLGFECRICEAQFTKNSLVLQHERLHERQKAFERSKLSKGIGGIESTRGTRSSKTNSNKSTDVTGSSFTNTNSHNSSSTSTNSPSKSDSMPIIVSTSTGSTNKASTNANSANGIYYGKTSPSYNNSITMTNSINTSPSSSNSSSANCISTSSTNGISISDSLEDGGGCHSNAKNDTNQGNILCGMCGELFSAVWFLRLHMRNRHCKFYCDTCCKFLQEKHLHSESKMPAKATCVSCNSTSLTTPSCDVPQPAKATFASCNSSSTPSNGTNSEAIIDASAITEASGLSRSLPHSKPSNDVTLSDEDGRGQTFYCMDELVEEFLHRLVDEELLKEKGVLEKPVSEKLEAILELCDESSPPKRKADSLRENIKTLFAISVGEDATNFLLQSNTLEELLCNMLESLRESVS